MFKAFEVRRDEVRLDNGSNLVRIHKKGAPVHIQACVTAGSVKNLVPGTAHFLEHMLVSGTEKYPTKNDLSETMSNVGGYFDALTDRDLIRLTVSVPYAKDVSLACEVLSQMVTASIFSDEVFRSEKQVILREIEDKLHAPEKMLPQLLLAQMYDEYVLHHNNLGTRDSLKNLDLETLLLFKDVNIVAENTTFIAVGDFDSDRIYQNLKDIKLERQKATESPKSIVDDFKMDVVEGGGDVAHVGLGYRCDARTGGEIASLFLMQHFLSGRNNPLLHELRYKRGLVYSGKTLYWNYSGTGSFMCITSCRRKNAKEVLSVMQEVIAAVTPQNITTEMFEKLKLSLQAQYMFDLQTSRQWLNAESLAVRHKGCGVSDAFALLASLEVLSLDEFVSSVNTFIATGDQKTHIL